MPFECFIQEDYHLIPTFNTSGKESSMKPWGKRRKCQHFLLFPQCFLLFPPQILIFESLFYFVICRSGVKHHSINQCFEFGRGQNFILWLKVQGQGNAGLCLCGSVLICLDHNFYRYVWISK